jgi:membrane protease YdiL (CAAX protease family)
MRPSSGSALPRRASIAVLAATALIVVDQLGLLMPQVFGALGDHNLRGLAIERFFLFLVVPLSIVVFGFRDDPRRYGLRLGDWRWGLALLIAGLAAMTPVILAVSSLPSFSGYYGGDVRPFGDALASNLIELIPAEFLFRGFVMFALWRRIGPLALVVAQVPFVLTHIGKPDVELWSTFIGGSVFAWLDWRTGSILWSALGHVYVLTLMLVLVGGRRALALAPSVPVVMRRGRPGLPSGGSRRRGRAGRSHPPSRRRPRLRGGRAT